MEKSEIINPKQGNIDLILLNSEGQYFHAGIW